MKTLREAEDEAIIAALQETRGNVERAAVGLGVSKSKLYRRVYAIEITAQEWRRLFGTQKPRQKAVAARA